ncbi:probable WRKY transcription factor 70 [Olea europaea subsp. europaea]|uniref:Probable WRKY transcription factor 70 n=1 Tax=Olea europaea subsp. europaea TaxID=158383 RepID=A0A8S0T272_OLEEU|nr:probable WRKY transcription factor 70 [Olea europaea subsp. europaea]
MESCCPASSLSTVRKRLLDELILGQESANMLRVILCKTQMDKRCKLQLFAQSLIDKILDSFDKSLSILNCNESNKVSDFLVMDSSDSDGQKSEDSTKRTNTSESLTFSKRRRTSKTWTRETVAASFADSHVWRKYGQKGIRNAEHPRNYFRCTYKYDQGCQARKLVQKIQDEPPLYRTTYHEHHTCKNLYEESQIITGNTTKDSSIIWSFDSHEQNYKPNGKMIPTLPKMPLETKENFQILHQNKSSSPSDYFISPDITTFESFGHFSDFSSAFDQGHVICSDMDIERMVGPVFDEFLELWYTG